MLSRAKHAAFSEVNENTKTVKMSQLEHHVEVYEEGSKVLPKK